MNGRFDVARPRRAVRHSLVRKLDQSDEQASVIELAQQGLVLFGQADGSVPSLLRSSLRVATTSGDAFTHSEAIAISVTATPWV